MRDSFFQKELGSDKREPELQKMPQGGGLTFNGRPANGHKPANILKGLCSFLKDAKGTGLPKKQYR
ncbi:MAG: hypothetical protein PHV51_00415 [Methanosarcinaceae archaeon]|nr:hypothetical protein [Methanosarcinaceae archaeon]MDD4496610.1 hypothetical protein [Methanosarcinaceae archaeon]